MSKTLMMVGLVALLGSVALAGPGSTKKSHGKSHMAMKHAKSCKCGKCAAMKKGKKMAMKAHPANCKCAKCMALHKAKGGM